MNDLKKADCVNFETAVTQLHVARGTLRAYINALSVSIIKFPLDRRGYISKVDFERVKALLEENRS